MKAYLINPYKMKVSQLEIDYKGIDSIYDAIQACPFDIVYLNEDKDVAFVDDEGLLRDPETQRFFWFTDFDHPLAGKALILGTDDEGDTIAPQCSLDWLKSKVKWIDHNTLMMVGGNAWQLAVIEC